MLVPPETQEQICTYIENNLVPDIKRYVKEKYPEIDGVPIEHISLDRLDFCNGPFKLLFDVEQHYNLYLMGELLKFKRKRYFKVVAMHTVGAAIRISKDIKKEEHADRITEIINNSFIPDEHIDPERLSRKFFFWFLLWLRFCVGPMKN
jgi:hypothetical protein